MYQFDVDNLLEIDLPVWIMVVMSSNVIV